MRTNEDKEVEQIYARILHSRPITAGDKVKVIAHLDCLKSVAIEKHSRGEVDEKYLQQMTEAIVWGKEIVNKYENISG